MKLITLKDAVARLGLSQSTLRRMILRGEFIAAVQVSPKRMAFVEAEVDAWLASRRRPQAVVQFPATGA